VIELKLHREADTPLLDQESNDSAYKRNWKMALGDDVRDPLETPTPLNNSAHPGYLMKMLSGVFSPSPLTT